MKMLIHAYAVYYASQINSENAYYRDRSFNKHFHACDLYAKQSTVKVCWLLVVAVGGVEKLRGASVVNHSGVIANSGHYSD